METNPKLELVRSLLASAIVWARSEANTAAAAGRKLTAEESHIARRVGVKSPERVRIQERHEMPMPVDLPLRQATIALGMDRDFRGMTLGYSIILKQGAWTVGLLSHELRHVAQYEAATSFESYIGEYLEQVARFGYWDAPMERDARGHQLSD